MSNNRIYDLIETMGRMVKNGINPSILIERGKVLDFLRKFGFNASGLSVLKRKYAFYPSLDVLIEEVLKQGDRKEEMLKRAEYEVEEYKKAAETSIDNELKEKREKIVELEKRVAGLEKRKSLLERDVDFLEERVDELKFERWTDIGKLELFASLINGRPFDTLGILYDLLVSALEEIKVPPLLENSIKDKYSIELPSEIKQTRGAHIGPFVGHFIPSKIG